MVSERLNVGTEEHRGEYTGHSQAPPTTYSPHIEGFFITHIPYWVQPQAGFGVEGARGQAYTAARRPEPRSSSAPRSSARVSAPQVQRPVEYGGGTSSPENGILENVLSLPLGA
ncbi:hypothetical protein SKAU_G00130180 [Synaphobranchus kaupii]|uniref:Uncharacterized protein n=1 Tax=Synaphobranchus kaupii TaxID=118154 RepID=A0A9Q1J147_SYNKA|nr:hypothetical protein SKAU_G00130180 [Synaphobranchus kaupii]